MFSNAGQTYIYIMTPTVSNFDSANPDNVAQSGEALKYPDPIGRLVALFNRILPGVPIATFNYYRTTPSKSEAIGPYGKAMVCE